MPLYEYQCDACGHRFEKIQKFSDAKEDTCPKCGGVVQKLVSSPAIQFKGSGFYITDYAKKSSSDSSGRKRSDGDSAKSDKGDSGDSAKSDSSSSGDSSSSKSSESSSTKTTDSTSSSSSSSSSKD